MNRDNVHYFLWFTKHCTYVICSGKWNYQWVLYCLSSKILSGTYNYFCCILMHHHIDVKCFWILERLKYLPLTIPIIVWLLCEILFPINWKLENYDKGSAVTQLLRAISKEALVYRARKCVESNEIYFEKKNDII